MCLSGRMFIPEVALLQQVSLEFLEGAGFPVAL